MTHTPFDGSFVCEGNAMRSRVAVFVGVSLGPSLETDSVLVGANPCCCTFLPISRVSQSFEA